LEYAGALVSAGPSARGALATLEAIRPDVLLVDFDADTESAASLIERVRAASWGAEIPSIAVSTRGGRDEHQRLLKAGFQQHLLRPIDPWELCRLVASLAQRGG